MKSILYQSLKEKIEKYVCECVCVVEFDTK